MTPIENIPTMDEHTKIHPGVLAKKDQTSGLVDARYRLISDRNTPATAAYRAKTMAIVMTILGNLPSLPWIEMSARYRESTQPVQSSSGWLP